jgi:antirestriction protein ArdC
MAQSASRVAARARPANDRATLYEEITNKILAQLEAGRLPWVQPWGSSGVRAPLGLPRNAATGRTYSGINVLILWDAVVELGHSAQSWLTFRQTLALGGHVRKGERGTTIVYADRFIPDDERERAREGGGRRAASRSSSASPSSTSSNARTCLTALRRRRPRLTPA